VRLVEGVGVGVRVLVGETLGVIDEVGVVDAPLDGVGVGVGIGVSDGLEMLLSAL
jgi:hypothetical protein